MQTNKNRQLRQRNGENRRHRKKQLRLPHIRNQIIQLRITDTEHDPQYHP